MNNVGRQKTHRPKNKTLAMARLTVTRKRPRQNHGSVLVEGVVALCIIIAGTVGGALLLINTGCATYYKEKLGFVDNQAAIFAANEAALGFSASDVQTKTQAFVNELLTAMGMPESQDITVTVDNDKVTVATKLVNLSLIGNGSVLPAFVSVQDSSVYKRNRALFPVVMDCNVTGNSGRLYVAAYCAQGPLLSPTSGATLTGGPMVGTKPLKMYGRFGFSASYPTDINPNGSPSP